MKIKICIACMLVFGVIGTLCGCGTSTNGAEASVETETITDAADIESIGDELIDNTAQFSNTFTLDGTVIIQDMAVSVDFGVIYPDLESVYNRASNVVVGEVMDVQYTDDDAIPRTIYTFAVSETLKGSIDENSLISISESNGYVRVNTVIETFGMAPYENMTDDEIANGVVLQSLRGAPLPEIGDQYIVFLGEQKQEGRISGAYAVIGNFMGKYVLDQDTDLYSRFCPNENPELYTVRDPVTNAIIQEEPMSLPEIREKILSYQ